MNHWPFIITSYAVFALFLLLDALLPQLRQRRLMKSLAQRSQRQRNRNTNP
jgi:heme exporter protein CcmD